MPPKLRPVSVFIQNLILGIILLHQSVYIPPAHILHILGNLIDGVSVDLPAKLHLGLHLVALGHGHIPHVVRHPDHPDMTGFHDTHRGAHPSRNAAQSFFVAPMAHDHLPLKSHAGDNMAILPIPVGRLVLIHEIHVDGIIGNLQIELGMKMTQRLAVLLQSQNPRLCRGKGVHPCNDPRTFPVHVRLIEQPSDHLIGEQGWLPHQLIRKQTGLIDLLHHDSGMLRHLGKTFVTIQILRTCGEPKLIILHRFIPLLS